MSAIDENSFKLGKLTGHMEELLEEMREVKKDVADIKRTLNHQKVKHASLSATVSLVFAMLYSFLMEHIKK